MPTTRQLHTGTWSFHLAPLSAVPHLSLSLPRPSSSRHLSHALDDFSYTQETCLRRSLTDNVFLHAPGLGQRCHRGKMRPTHAPGHVCVSVPQFSCLLERRRAFGFFPFSRREEPVAPGHQNENSDETTMHLVLATSDTIIFAETTDVLHITAQSRASIAFFVSPWTCYLLPDPSSY
jgi:hypothetical protein